MSTSLKRVGVVPDGPVYQRKGWIVREYVAKKRADGVWTWRAGDLLHSVASELQARELAVQHARDTGELYTTRIKHGTLLAREEILLLGPTLAEQFGQPDRADQPIVTKPLRVRALEREPKNHACVPYIGTGVACRHCITNNAPTPSLAIAVAPHPVGNRRDTAEWHPVCANHLERHREEHPSDTLPVFWLDAAYVPAPEAADPDPFAFAGDDPERTPDPRTGSQE